jgi:hypothetical protein
LASRNDTTSARFERALAYEGLPIRAMFKSWAAELAPFRNRWRRAARVAFVTAVGAGIMATLQIANPLGLTLLVSLAAPEFVFSFATGIVFLLMAAIIQVFALFMVGALADSPVLLVAAFIVFTAISTYLIYGVRRLGRLWLWIQIPSITAFYMVLFDHRSLGWENAQMYAGTAIAVALLLVFNNLLWPVPAEMVLANSLRSTLARSRRRLRLLVAIFLGEATPDHDRTVASKLAYHLALLRPATRQADEVRGSANLLAAVMVAERIHNEIERLCVVACKQLGRSYADARKRDLREITDALDGALDEYIVHITQPTRREHMEPRLSVDLFRARSTHLSERGALDEVAEHLVRIGDLLIADARELPYPSAGAGRYPLPRRPFRPNKFLVRFCVRHTIAMTLAFMAGLYDNSAAIHAALWLLMIGGPPSHGATARKFTMRAIGSSGALLFAALGTIVLAPNFTSIPPYLAAIFIGVLLMTYLGEGGGQLSYLAIGATAFVIAFSGPGPRPDMMGSIWTIWGISLGMVIRAIVSAVSIELPNRTLAEEIERPLNGLAALVPDSGRLPAEVAAADLAVIAGIEDMLDVAADAQLQGRSSGIDARNLVDALDTMRRLAFAMGNLRRQPSAAADFEEFDSAVRSRIESWLASIRSQLEREPSPEAPLLRMVSSAGGPDLTVLLQSRPADSFPADREHVARLIHVLEGHLTTVRLQ